MSTQYLAFTLILALVGFANSESDAKQCENQLVGLATCLSYVGGNGKAPSSDCCDAVRQVVKNNMVCLCILIKDRNDPSLGLKVNVTLALRLPTTCNAPVDLTQCPVLLHLAPNSADAKVFDDFENNLKGNNNSTPASNGNVATNGSNGEMKSEGGRVKRWLVIETICVMMSYIIFHK
ncbi:hypothetical protein U1Q18_032058 [Sarracenia purpurea var. burkii]